MDDKIILERINTLIGEEHELLGHEAERGPAAEHRERLQEVQETLDQCWDLLRQRRALREFGRDPDTAGTRSKHTVERYEQ